MSTVFRRWLIPVVDSNQCYAEYAVGQPARLPRKPFKIGVVGGVGPQATVDFMSKVVKLTEARRDQDHVKMIVEQNPQIPDRTEFIVGRGTDPTVALFATCKKLEAGEADLIAIPCNTAHAFIMQLQPHLRIPIVNMLDWTMSRIVEQYPNHKVGLLATTGTIQSGIYVAAAERIGVSLLLPDQKHQLMVMESIYGPLGAKAGFTDGKCRDDLFAVLKHLSDCGATVAILGCTELPLILARDDRFAIGDKEMVLLDPTMLLAAACVRHSRAASSQV